MKPPSFLIVLLLTLLASLASGSASAGADLGPEEYWKHVMRDQPIPDAIRGLIPKDSNQRHRFTNSKTFYLTDFDTENNIIIYHKSVIIN